MRQRLMSALVLAALFLSGLAVGMAADRFLHRPPFRGGHGEHPMGPPNAAMRERIATKVSERLKEDLGLTDEQAGRIRAMIPGHIAALDSVRAAVAPQIDSVVQRSAAEIAAVLTPDQRARWEKSRRHGGLPGVPPMEGGPADRGDRRPPPERD